MSNDSSIFRPLAEEGIINANAFLNQALDLIANSAVLAPSLENSVAIADAHYRVAIEQDISPKRAKLHLNCAITLLQKLYALPNFPFSLLAKSLMKRAHLFELESEFHQAIFDYNQALMIFEDNALLLIDEEWLLLAECAIAIADLLTHSNLDQDILPVNAHPLFYINKGLKCLSLIHSPVEAAWPTLAYAHFLAGLNLSESDMLASLEAFRTSVRTLFKTDTEIACQNLGDIYRHIGLLYALHFEKHPPQKRHLGLNDYAFIYFGISILFTPGECIDIDPGASFSELLFETIYRAVDPYFTPISLTVMRDFIDALLFAYYCIMDESLTNKFLLAELKEKKTLQSFVKHIYLLVSFAFEQENPIIRLLKGVDSSYADKTLDKEEIMNLIKNKGLDNIHYLRRQTLSVKA